MNGDGAVATPPGDGGNAPREGYYPDPSIPGYVRYWNGAAWVPGTSRPAPKDGEGMPTPPPAAVSAPVPAPAPAPAPAPSVEETGPMFFDELEEEPAAETRPEPASAWQADTARQTGFGGDRDRRVSWGAPEPQEPAPTSADPRRPASASAPAARESERSVDPTGGQLPGVRQVESRTPEPQPDGGTMTIRAMSPQPQPAPRTQQPEPQPLPRPRPQPQVPAQAHPQPQPAPQPAEPQTPVTQGPGGGAASWAQQVHQLAQPDPQPQPQVRVQQPQTPVMPWKPPVEDPFLKAAQAQAAARPAALGKRLAARVIDTVVLGAAVGAVSVPFVLQALDHINGKIEAAKQSGVTVQVWLVDSTTSVHFGIALAALLVLGVLYEAVPTAKWGRTLGKKLCGIEVRDIEAHEPPTFGAALRRWLVYSVLGLLVLGVLNVLWCLFDRPWRQCWHDKAARTFVAG
ncbi:RDD family protein [Streptomyces purpureus]|uniref:RDD family protein n=1 Tax=Streptomyces purpureus TaxID=1951 RepID=UPI003CC7EC14